VWKQIFLIPNLGYKIWFPFSFFIDKNCRKGTVSQLAINPREKYEHTGLNYRKSATNADVVLSVFHLQVRISHRYNTVYIHFSDCTCL